MNLFHHSKFFFFVPFFQGFCLILMHILKKVGQEIKQNPWKKPFKNQTIYNGGIGS